MKAHLFQLVRVAIVVACASCGASEAAPSDASASPVDAAGAVVDAGSRSDAAPDATTPAPSALTLTSSAFASGGALPASFTCDGAGTSPPLAWSGVPAGTAELAMLMSTEARDGRKWNWVLYAIPSEKTGIAAAATDVGKAGITSDGPLLQYYPPCSQGPGAKSYTFTLYALAAKPTLPAVANQVTGAAIEAAIANVTLAKSELTVTYTRP